MSQQKSIFKMAPTEHYKRKVRVSVPQDFGKHSVVDITIHFKRLTHTELRDLFKQIQRDQKAAQDALDAGEEADDADSDILRQHVVGWGTDVLGPDDQPVPFSPDNLDALLDITVYRRSLMKAFLEDLADGDKKNRGKLKDIGEAWVNRLDVEDEKAEDDVDADLQRFGFAPRRRPEISVVEVEPDNALALEMFFLISTQWRMSFAGPVGLDYSALSAVMSYRSVPAKKRGDTFDRVRAIEYAALGEMGRQAKEAGDKANGSRGRAAAKR